MMADGQTMRHSMAGRAEIMMSSQDNDQSTAPRRGPFFLWLIITTLLALAVAIAWWALQNRPPVVVEVEGQTPAPEALSAEQQAEIARLSEIAALRESQLRQSVDAIDPPVCEAPKALDVGKFTSLRRRESDNFTEWRALLDTPTPRANGPQSRITPESNAALSPTEATQDGTGQNTAPSTELASSTQLALPALREKLEKTTVLVLGISGGEQPDLGAGTGFFIGPRLLVTNDHVIEGADPAQIFVTNRRLGSLRQARLVSRSRQSGPGDLDFALLEIDGAPVSHWLTLSDGKGKLTPVIAAGYPGLTLGSDEGFRKLLRGDLTSAPDLNMNRGEIRSVRPFAEITQIIHTADVLKGYSGGPLIDLCGRIVGVNTFIQVDKDQASKLNNAIAASDLTPFLTSAGASFTETAGLCAPPE